MKTTDKQENKIRIMLADDHLIVREGLVTVLGEEPDFEFVGFAEDGEQACEEYARLLPGVCAIGPSHAEAGRDPGRTRASE